MAGKGGGAWKVAYADFVTAMMAFFLVMWIVGQDQKIRRSVSEYFSDPMGTESSGPSKKPTRTGSSYESISSGKVPLEENVSMGRGRSPFTQKRKSSGVTKLVNDWIRDDKQLSDYWMKQAQHQREAARWSKSVKDGTTTLEKEAARLLLTQLKDEFKRDIPAKTKGMYRDILEETFLDVHWEEIAEDLIDQP